MNKIEVCVVIPIKNEEKNLPQCLAPLSEFEEVWIIDSSSEDNSELIVQEYGYNYLNFHWNGNYPKKRNWFILNNFTKLPWLLFIDADEIVTEEFKKQLLNILPNTPHSGFWLSYDNYFLGKKLKYGVSQKKLALIQNGRALYEYIPDRQWSSLDMEIHEHPQVKGSVGFIRANITHRSISTYADIIQRHNDYASWEARRYVELSQTNGALRTHTLRQRVKYLGIKFIGFAELYFIYTYLIKLGFLDRKPGLRYANLKMQYFRCIRKEIKRILTD
jgi:glycosyltransferase involved in cell wall biosynthesis